MSPLRIALYVSLGVNLFIVGWWVGDISRRPPPMEPRPVNIAGIAQNRLDPATMEAIGPALQSIDAVLRAGFDSRDRTFHELSQAVAAEPYDAATVDRLLKELIDQRVATEIEQWGLVGEALGALTAEQRVALASILFLRPARPMPPGPGGPPPN